MVQLQLGNRWEGLISISQQKDLSYTILGSEVKVYTSNCPDDKYIGKTIQFHQMAVDPSLGKHSLTIVDENGETVTRNFEILNKTADLNDYNDLMKLKIVSRIILYTLIHSKKLRIFHL